MWETPSTDPAINVQYVTMVDIYLINTQLIHTQYILPFYRFLLQQRFVKTPIADLNAFFKLPKPVLWILRSRFKKRLDAQGIGLHSEEEAWVQSQQTMDALSKYLGKLINISLA